MNLLTQYFYINAWLDCSSPFISLHRRTNGDLFAHFSSEKLNRILDSGDINLEDLQSTNQKKQSSVIKYLIALNSVEQITKQLKKLEDETVCRNTNVIPISKYQAFFSLPINSSQVN